MTRSVSVIIPALDEARLLGRTLERVAAGDPREIIVVDGGSTDDTTRIAANAGATVLGAQRGRGRQMNAGAAAAHGDTLLFLHADTLLPEDWPTHVHATLADPAVAVGAFHLRIDGTSPALRMVERAVAWRSRVRQRPYGDQGMFLPAVTFHRAGGFPDQPLLEDVELVARLRRLGRVSIAPATVLTSDRRWRRYGVPVTTAMNQACLVAHRLGVSADRIAAWRNGRREAGGRIASGTSLRPDVAAER